MPDHAQADTPPDRQLLPCWPRTLTLISAGIAHDFGNNIAGIQALADALLEQAPPHGELAESLRLILDNSRQAHRLVRHLVDLHQARTGDPGYHDLNRLASELASLARAALPRRVTLDLDLAPRALPVFVDPVALRQAILPILTTTVPRAQADHPAATRLTLRTRSLTPTPSRAETNDPSPGAPSVALSWSTPARDCEPDSPSAWPGSNELAGIHRGRLTFEDSPGGTRTWSFLLPEADLSEHAPAPPAALRP